MSTHAAAPVDSAPDGRILIRRDDGPICRLTLNRPAQYNTLSEAMLDELQDVFDALAERPDIRVVIIGGAGKAFCAGHDLKEMRANPDRDYYEALFAKCSRMMISMLRLPQPVIARVHGLAIAAGCQLVANADLAVASDDAGLGTSGINVGLFCMTPGVALSRNVGRKRAFEMLFTGDIIAAEQAMEAGLINKVTTPEDLDTVVDGLAQSIIEKSRTAVAAGKRVFYTQLEKGIEDAYAYAGKEMACNMMFDDTGEGIDAFIQKRKPVWKHK